MRAAALRAAGFGLFAVVVLSGCAGGPAGPPSELAVPAPNVSVPAPTDAPEPAQATQSPPAPPAEAQPPAQAPAPPAPPAPPEPKLSEGQAQQISLSHAKAPANTTVYCNIDFDDDMRTANPEWDCEFIVGEHEYNYEIDAVTGEIVNYERESVWD